jgi:seryl-tRNA synthetase
MIDIKIIRTQPDIIRDSISKRNLSIDFDSFLELDKERLTQKQQLETLQALRNKVSKEVPMIQNTQEKEIKISEMKAVNTEIAEIEESLKKSQDAYENLLYAIPNLLDPTTAIGADESQNQVEAVYGTIPQFSFEPKPHYEIGEARGWIDTEKGAEVSGARFWYLKGDLVLLQFAILQYVMGVMVNKGFTPVIPPFLVREPAMFGTGFFPADRNQIYEVNPWEDNLYLIGTSEVSLTSYHGKETIDVSKPIKYVGYSPCFRREAGTYGKDMKGILRGHQFDKIEMVCFAKPEDSQALHNEMVALEEEIWNNLGIPFHKLNVCSGDLGNPAMKKYDLEAWIPSQQKYREVTSCSNIGSFQSRRLDIKYRRPDGSSDYVHTLNGSIIAFSRCLMAIIENFQNEDMTVRIPEVLQPFMGGRKVL